MAANITRSVKKCNAFAIVVKVDGMTATVEKSDSVEFFSTNPTETEAARALREAGIKCKKADVRFEIVEEVVYAMTLDTFIEHAVIVERGKGGYIRKSDMVASE